MNLLNHHPTHMSAAKAESAAALMNAEIAELPAGDLDAADVYVIEHRARFSRIAFFDADGFVGYL